MQTQTLHSKLHTLASVQLQGASIIRGLGLSLAAAAVVGCAPIPRMDVTASGKSTSESGAGIDLTVSLRRRPLTAVTVYATSSDSTEGSVSGSVRFDPSNWQTPQRIRVTGVDDSSDDGDIPYEVRVFAMPAGTPNAQATEVASFELTNIDDEVARFEAVGDLPGGDFLSVVTDVSWDGNVIVGYSAGASGEEAMRFSAEKGLEALGGGASRAYGVSPEGTLVTGYATWPDATRGGALWHEDGTVEQLMGPHVPADGPEMFHVSEGRAVLEDGRVFGVCTQYGVGDFLGCRYDGPGQVSTFGTGSIYAADAAGNFAGVNPGSHHGPYITYASYNAGNLPFPTGVNCQPMGDCSASAWDFSAGGAIVVGTSNLPEPNLPPSASGPYFENAFAYTAANGSAFLPDLPGDPRASGARAISQDGRIIAGFGSDAVGKRAVVWVDEAPVPLEDLLVGGGGTLPTGWQLTEVVAMSADGAVLVGNGVNADGHPEGFRVTLASVP